MWQDLKKKQKPELLLKYLNFTSYVWSARSSICGCVFTGNASRLSLQVSGDGMRVLLVAITGKMFLWECLDIRDLSGLRDGTVDGRWTHICPLEDSILPSLQDKEASQHTIFIKTEVSNWLEYIHCICIYIIWHIASVFSHWKTWT